jgi:phage baseplate assembly protein W
MNRDYLGTGLQFPLGVDGSGRIALATGEQRVEQSIALVLGTRLGERMMLPRFGCGAHDLLFEANDATSRGILKSAVHEALSLLENRIDVLDIEVDTSPSTPSLVLVRVDYRIRSNNAIGNLVYPFYIREGV